MTYPNHPVEPHTQTTGEKLTEAAESVKAKALDTAHTVTSKIAAGTEMLSEEARSRVIAARRKATEAGQSTRQTLRRGRQSAGDFFESQPLVVGALAVALGAAISGLIPRSRFEDEHMGSQRDRLVAEADRILEEEKRKLGAVADAAVSEAKAILGSKADAVREVTGDRTLAGVVIDEVKWMGGQIADAATEAAQRNDLGKPKL